MFYKADPLVNGSLSVDDFFFFLPSCSVRRLRPLQLFGVIPAGANRSCASVSKCSAQIYSFLD